MSSQELANLAHAGWLKKEAPDRAEIGRMLAVARTRLADAGLARLSPEGRFNSAYSAAHSAALRWHGYRSESRYLVFQCLEHTIKWPPQRWRVLDAAHRKRNLAEYEGFAEFEDSAIEELRAIARQLIEEVSSLTDR